MAFHDEANRVLQGLQTIESRRNREYLRDLGLSLRDMIREFEALEARAASLARRVQELEEKTRVAGELVSRDGALWRPDNPDPGPYCATCWDRDRKLVQIFGHRDGRGGRCPRCS
jgi:hypothetical protein